MTDFQLETFASRLNVAPEFMVQCACRSLARADTMIYIGNLPTALRQQLKNPAQEFACGGCRWLILHLTGITLYDIHKAHNAPADIIDRVKKYDNAVARSYGKAKVHQDVD